MHLPLLFHQSEEQHGCTRSGIGYSDTDEQMGEVQVTCLG